MAAQSLATSDERWLGSLRDPESRDQINFVVFPKVFPLSFLILGYVNNRAMYGYIHSNDWQGTRMG